MVLAERQTPNHILHLLLSIVTAGLWLIVWALMILSVGRFKCPHCGTVTRGRPPKNWKPQTRAAAFSAPPQDMR